MGAVLPKPRLVGAENSERFATYRDLGRDEQRSIYRQWLCGTGTVTALARRYGVERADVEEILQRELVAEEERIRVESFAAGKRSAWNLPPITTAGLRRAA